MKVWITKYALTEGIIEAEAEQSVTSPKLIQCEREGRFSDVIFPSFYGENKEWHRSLEGAREYANEMVQKKIKSMEKQLAKLRKLEF